MITVCQVCHSQNRLPAARLHQSARCAHCKEPVSPPNHPIEMKTPGDFDELVHDSPQPVLVDFWAEWCAPCRLVAPEMIKIAHERHKRVIVAKVDTEALPSIAQRYAIESIPTMILFRDGRVAQRLSGARPASAILRELDL
jgi:thioredoxin 2